MKMLDQLRLSIAALTASVAEKHGHCPDPDYGHAPTLDELFAHETKLQSFLSASTPPPRSQPTARQATGNRGGKPMTHAESKAALLSGTRTAAQISAQDGVSRLTALRDACKQGSVTWKALSGRIEHERKKLTE